MSRFVSMVIDYAGCLFFYFRALALRVEDIPIALSDEARELIWEARGHLVSDAYVPATTVRFRAMAERVQKE